VRLCKGIYVEPPAIAYTDYEAVRANYVRALHERSAIDGAHLRDTGSASTRRTATSGYAYSLRRLQENPELAGTIACDTVERIFGRPGATGERWAGGRMNGSAAAGGIVGACRAPHCRACDQHDKR
jgi:hypothetical protein